MTTDWLIAAPRIPTLEAAGMVQAGPRAGRSADGRLKLQLMAL